MQNLSPTAVPRHYVVILEVTADSCGCAAYMMFPRLGKLIVFGVYPGQRIIVTYFKRTRRGRRYMTEVFYTYEPRDYATIYLRNHLAKGLVNNLVDPTEKLR